MLQATEQYFSSTVEQFIMLYRMVLTIKSKVDGIL